MKKIKLDAGKLQLKRESVAPLTNEQMGKIMGGEPLTGVTVKNCCLPCTYDDVSPQNPGTCPVELTTLATCEDGCGFTLGGQFTCYCVGHE